MVILIQNISLNQFDDHLRLFPAFLTTILDLSVVHWTALVCLKQGCAIHVPFILL